MKTLIKRLVLALLLVTALIVAAAAILSGLRVDRPPAPPPDLHGVLPWGAIEADAELWEGASDLELSLEASFRDESEGEFDPDDDGVREYDILVLSGGGSAGAFGAGLLAGWSKNGSRPDFKVVTGVSAGALQATFAFLGSAYDDDLKAVFTDYETERIYRDRGLFEALLGDAAKDSEPLAELIERYIDEAVLAEVAKKHALGHRLFVGTSNMDTKEFVIWDMGAIASSERPGKLEHYRKILLASSSIPVVFPPVYFEIESNGEKYYEMHADGGARSQLFLRGFMLDLEDALEDSGIADEDIEARLFVIRNGLAEEFPSRRNIKPTSLAIAAAMISGVFEISTESSLYRIYVLANRYGIDFNLASIPMELGEGLDPLVFDLGLMDSLYWGAFERAEKGYEWSKVPAGLDPDEIAPER